MLELTPDTCFTKVGFLAIELKLVTLYSRYP